MLISLLALQQSRNKPASLYKPLTQSLSFHRPRHTIQTHASPTPPKPTGNQIAACVLMGWCAPSGVLVRTIFLCAHVMRKQAIISPTLSVAGDMPEFSRLITIFLLSDVMHSVVRFAHGARAGEEPAGNRARARRRAWTLCRRRDGCRGSGLC